MTTPDFTTDWRLRSQYTAQGGISAIFSDKVLDYVASRPGYPAPLFETLGARCALSPGAQIVDVGAGTGILTRALLEQGWKVTAVEPNAPMRMAAEAELSPYPGYRSVEGTVEAMPVESSTVELITAAQAFHWFDAIPARHECRRVLKPYGQVALIWNDWEDGDPLHLAFDHLAATYGGTKRSALVAHEDRKDVPLFFGGSHYEQFHWPNAQQLDEAGFHSLIFSRSYIPARETEAGREVSREASRIFQQFAEESRITIRYRTVLMLGRPEEPQPHE
ncbi:MAG: class I SAM-dependent methyltransferase [Chthoniobacteraceae bacterium]